MATVDKDFRVKHGLVVEGTTATVNGEDVITTGSTTDNLGEGTTNLYYTEGRAKTDAAELLTGATLTNITITGNGDGLTITAENGGIQDLTGFDTDDLTEGTTNKYFTNQRALDATSAAYDPAGSAATAEQNANDYTDTAISNLPANFITSTTSEFSVTDGELSLDQLNGSTQINPASGLQPNNGYATIEYTDTDSGTEGLKIKSERGWVGSQIGGQLDVDAYRDVVITSRNGDIVLNADGDTYLGSVASGNDIATTGYVDGLASNYDPAGSAATAESNANTYTDTAINGLDTDDIEEGPTNLYFTNQRALDATAAAYDAAGAAAAAQSAAESYADGLAVNYDAAGSAAAAQTAAEGYTDTAIANLVDGAPSLLNTLNELAAAINDDESFATTVANSISAKQDTLTAGTGITIDQITDTISVTANTYEAYGAAGTAETNANAYTDTAINALTTTDIEEGTNLYFTDARAVDALEAVVPNFTAVEVNSLAKQVAATATSLGSVEVTAYSFPKATYRTAKFIVKIDNGTENEVTEVLLTLDSGDNVAITEYAIVGTNGNRGSITADVSGSNVRLRVNPVNDSTINVVGTLLA